MAGKVGGALAATPFTDLTLRQTHLIGWGMNSRGSVELVLAELARSYGLLTSEVYSAIVAMSIFVYALAALRFSALSGRWSDGLRKQMFRTLIVDRSP